MSPPAPVASACLSRRADAPVSSAKALRQTELIKTNRPAGAAGGRRGADCKEPPQILHLTGLGGSRCFLLHAAVSTDEVPGWGGGAYSTVRVLAQC